MTVFIALIRGINVGGQKRVGMAELVHLFQSLGFGSVRTYLQSGNVIFESTDSVFERLSAMIGEYISRKTGFPVKVILRTAEEFRHIIASNPLASDGLDATKLHVTFLSAIPPGKVGENMMHGEDGPDRYVIIGREVCLFCPDGYGRTKFSNTFFERKLGVDATTRNWKTVTSLGAMAEE
jgi:uncharacterized protein (DUF1697 family)